MTQRTILLVEDNEDDEALAWRSLKKHKLAHRVDVVRDGVEAVEYFLNEYKALSQLVLLDLNESLYNGISYR